MKQQTRRIFAALLSIVMTLSLCPWALADYPADTRTGAEGDYTGKTVILHSNDVHGEIMGYAYIAALKTEFESKGADVILADAGDFSQGDPTVSLSKGADAVAMMNAAGYDVATLGNHEFDFGYAQLMENLSAAAFPVICADVFEGDKAILPPTWTYEKDGLKIGFFGMETPETQTKVNPGLIQGIRFLSKGDIYTCAQEQIDALRSDGADVVIALAHLGVDAESAPDGHRSVDMYAHTQGIDLILDGHSHTVMTAGESGEPVQSTGTKFANIGVVVIDNEKEAIEDHYLIPTKVTETVEEDGKQVEKVVSELPKDAAVAAKAQEIIDRVDAEYGEVFAQSEILLNGERAPGNRTEETNLGDLITDAIVWKVLEANRGADGLASLSVDGKTVDEDHIVGVTNGGGIRASIEPGDVTRKDLNTVLPFGNTVAVVFVTGAELLEALEASTYATPEALGGYPQTFGIEFTLDTTKPYAQGDAYPESTYYSPASVQRVTITKINGEPFDPAATYAVVTNNFCAAGGDTYYVFKNASAQFDTGIVMDEAVMEYIQGPLKGVISKETYGEPRGDQTIILPPSYSVSVAGGSGSGEYVEGASVTITADAPESGKRFKEWTGADGLNFTSGSAMTETAVFVMPANAVSLTATYEEPLNAASPVEARFHFSPSIPGGQADAPAVFNPSWFFQSARSNYQSGLMQLSIRTAMAAFGTDATLEADDSAEPVRYLSEEAKDSTSANIVRLMRDLGFSKITADYQNPGLDTIGYAIANREISNEAGETARLILIAVRGGGYRQEWASNFTIGLSKEHQGFSEAASMVFETAQAYLSELRQDGYNGAVKFWITGYSRGAAVANLTARRLTDLAETDSGFTRDDVFACCLACPRNAILDSATASAYDNIVNVVHYADFVPKIPVAPWGYVRYGKTYYLPAPELTAQYAEASGKMAQSLSAFLGAIQPQPDTTVTQQSLWALTHLLNNQGRLTDRFTDTLAVHVGSQSGYVNMVQEAFRKAIEATEGRDGFGAFFQVLTGLPGYAERYQQSILPITQNGTQISLAHAPELYLAWLDALESAASYGRSRVLVVNGPADVTVLTESGATAAQITASGAADSVLPAYVDPDGQKIVPLPTDGTFRIELTASESGAVSYQIEETDLETGVTDRLTGYYEIPVAAGDRLSGTADALSSGVRGEYPLRSANGAALTPDADTRDAVRNCRVSVSIRETKTSEERIGFAQGGGLYVPGEYAQAMAIPAEKSVFLGWYENEKLLSQEAQFRFLVTADREVTAVFAEEKPSYQVSVTDGDGSGTYQEGDSVSISANKAPDGQVFDKWLGADGLNFISGNQNSDNATFAMPGNDVTLTATFRAQSAQGGQSSRGGCYVATAVYGSYDCPEVWTLRRFRDGVLAKTWYGRLFIRLYYAVSPTAVKLFGDCEWFQSFFRDRLDKMVSDLQTDGFESTPYQDRAW